MNEVFEWKLRFEKLYEFALVLEVNVSHKLTLWKSTANWQKWLWSRHLNYVAIRCKNKLDLLKQPQSKYWWCHVARETFTSHYVMCLCNRVSIKMRSLLGDCDVVKCTIVLLGIVYIKQLRRRICIWKKWIHLRCNDVAIA